MSNRNGRKRKGAQPAARAKGTAETKKSLRLRTAIWFGGVATAVTAGVLINVLSQQAQRVTQPPSPAAVSVSRAAQPSASPGKAISDSSGPPLTVVSEDPLNIDQMVVWVFPGEYLPSQFQLKYVNSLIRNPDSVPWPAFVQWFFSRGAYESGGTSTQLVVQNNRSHPVRIIDMNVIKQCRAPLTGTMFFGAGGAVDETVGLGFNLDSSDTEAEQAQGTGLASWKPDYFTRYTISIQPGAQQVFNLWTVTSRQACTFEYQVTVLDGEKKVTQIIGDGTVPFRATALVNNPSGSSFSDYKVLYLGYAWDPPNGAFTRVDPKTEKPLATG